MKRISFSLLFAALLVCIMALGVSAQNPTPTPTDPDAAETQDDPEVDIEEEIAEEIAEIQTDFDSDVIFLAPDTPITLPLDIGSLVPISMPIFLPTVVTTPQVITIPITLVMALPTDDFDALTPLGAGNAITAPVSLELVLTFETSDEITVMVAGVPAIVGGTFYTAPLTAAPTTPTVEVTQTTIITGANLRAGPGTLYPRVGGLTAGQVVTPVGQDETGTWYQLDDGNWVAAFLVNNPPAGLPIVEPPLLPPPVPATTPDEATPAAQDTPAAEATPTAEDTPAAEATPTVETTPVPEATPTAEDTPDAEETAEPEETPTPGG